MDNICMKRLYLTSAKVIELAERDLGTLSTGQKVDLLADHFIVQPLSILRTVVHALESET